MERRSRGITLIALVITIIVLLILAGISIAMLTGDNGVKAKAKKANIEYTHSTVREGMILAYNEYQADIMTAERAIKVASIAKEKVAVENITKDTGFLDYLKYKNYIDDNNIINVINLTGNKLSLGNGTGDDDVYKIEEQDETLIVNYYKQGSAEREIWRVIEENTSVSDVPEGFRLYNEPGAENNISPVDLFKYEVINNEEVNSIGEDGLPMWTARIIGISDGYLREYYAWRPSEDYFGDYTGYYNYGIERDGEAVSILVIPYQVEINGDLYKITEFNCQKFPCNVETLIFPNTCDVINLGAIDFASYGGEEPEKKGVTRIVLSDKIKNMPAVENIISRDYGVLTIPMGVETINQGTLDASVSGFLVDRKNEYFSSVDGVLFDKDKAVLIRCPQKKEGTYLIPSGTTQVGSWAFKECKTLSSIEIPDSVNNLGDSAFSRCSALENVIIPESVKVIGENAFYYCDSLSKVALPDDVVGIGRYAFYYCRKLKAIKMPSRLKSIGSYAFCGCSALENIEIPNGVEEIRNYAFSECSALKEIFIPKSVTVMEEAVFTYWKASQTINCEATSKPAGWSTKWDYYSMYMSSARKAQLNWGATRP